ncbi:MAG: Gldg family protein [Crocinitomicaceae bacterium]|nr:Gldg family protein [Crocinitomicaceae bacterium]
MSEKKTYKGIFNWSLLLIVLVGIVTINVISAFLYKRIDMTADQRYSLSSGTIKMLEDENAIKNRMTIRIYLEGTMPAEIKNFRNAIQDKLNEFKQYAGTRIEYKFIDPNQGTEEEQKELKDQLYNQGKGILPLNLIYQKDGAQSQILLWPGAIINYEGTDVNVIQFLPGTPAGKPNQLEGISQSINNAINNLEYILTSSIRRSVQTQKQRIGFLQGHGELTFAQTQRARALITPYYKVEDVTIDGQLNALDDYQGLIIANPRQKFDVKDLFVIDQFLMKGGRLMCFLDALSINEDTLNLKGMTHTTRIKTGLEDLLFDYGLKLNENYVLDARCAPKGVPFANRPVIPWFFHVLATPTAHPISRNLEPVSLKYTSEVQFVNSVNTVLTPILTSSTNSTVTGLAPMVNLGLPLNYGNNPILTDNPSLESNKKCLAGLSEGMFQSYFKTRIVDEYTKNQDAQFITESKQESKVLLVGNGRFIENRYDSTINNMTGQTMYKPIDFPDLRMDEELFRLNIQLLFGNREFFQNSVDYLMGDNSILDIRSRQIDIHEIDNAKVQQNAGFYKMINLLLPSSLLIILAFVFGYIRKRKYSTKK